MLLTLLLADPARGSDCVGVSGVVTWRTLTGTFARRAMAATTGSLAMTLPSRTPRCVSAWRSSVFTRRSRTADFGVSTTTCVVAVAISSARGVSRGGSRLILATLQTATIRARSALASTQERSCQSVQIRFPSFTFYQRSGTSEASIGTSGAGSSRSNIKARAEPGAVFAPRVSGAGGGSPFPAPPGKRRCTPGGGTRARR